MKPSATESDPGLWKETEMAQTKIRRTITTTSYSGVRGANGETTPVSGTIFGNYTRSALETVLNRANPGERVRVTDCRYSVNEYEMSLEDFVKYGTLKA